MDKVKPLILIVDDIPDNVEILGEILSPEYLIKFALNGQKALQLAQVSPIPDLILLDIMMPEMNGYDVCLALRKNPVTEKIPVIFVTAKNEDYDEVKGFEVGAVDYLTKPVSPIVVRARIKTHLQLQGAMLTLEKQKGILEENIRLREDVERITRHDLKSPLTAFINIPKMLMRDKNQTPDQVELLEILSKSGLRMLEMVNRSLDLYKMEKNQYIPNKVPGDVAKLVRQIFSELEVLASTNEIPVSLFINGNKAGDESNFIIQGEESLFFSMLSNLIKNALEASPPGKEVRADFSFAGKYLIEIKNQGEIPAAIRDRFLDRYVTFGKQGGTGRGVYSARLMARTLCGDLRFRSDPENGTVISVELPVITEAAASDTGAETGKPKVRPKSGVKILIADDYDYMRRIIIDLLHQMGFANLFEAENFSQSEAVLKNNKIDLVISDWHMPDKSLNTRETSASERDESGLKVFEALRKQPYGGKVPFILISGVANEDNLRKASQAGITEIVTKPFSPDILRKKISAALEIL